jgi:hypothetical protein
MSLTDFLSQANESFLFLAFINNEKYVYFVECVNCLDRDVIRIACANADKKTFLMSETRLCSNCEDYTNRAAERESKASEYPAFDSSGTMLVNNQGTAADTCGRRARDKQVLRRSIEIEERSLGRRLFIR